MEIENVKRYLPYAVIPIVCAAIFLVLRGGTDAFLLLKFELISVTGFIAAIIDLRTKRIPNKLVLAMLFAWCVIMTPKLFVDTDAAIVGLIDSISGFAIGGGIFLAVYLASGKGLGGGDVKFMAAAGLYLGFIRTIPTVLFGTILAGITGLVLILLKKIGRKDTMPLAPFLYIGIILTVFLQ